MNVLYGIFDANNPQFGTPRVFYPNCFTTPQKAIDFLAAEVGVIVEAEVHDDHAIAAVGKAIDLFKVEAI